MKTEKPHIAILKPHILNLLEDREKRGFASRLCLVDLQKTCIKAYGFPREDLFEAIDGLVNDGATTFRANRYTGGCPPDVTVELVENDE